MDMNFTLLIIAGLLLTFTAQGQNKKYGKYMSVKDSRNEVTILSPHALKVVQKGSGNVVMADQNDSLTSVKTSSGSQIIEKEGNRIIFNQNGNKESTEVSNSSVVNQSGTGNSVIIKQSGGGNRVSVSQSASKRK